MKSQNTLFQAIEFANWAHRHQKRKLADAPYVVHPFHVMLLLLGHGINPETECGLVVLVAGVLHDTLEDNPKEVTLALIHEKFGIDVAATVSGVTLDPDKPNMRLSKSKIIESNYRIRIVKVADVLSNTIATTDSIRKLGLAEVQKRFKQPIIERVQIEREFLSGARNLYDSFEPLVRIQQSAKLALRELEVALKE